MARHCRTQSRYNQAGPPHLRNFDGPINGPVPGRGGYMGGGPGRHHFNNNTNQHNNANGAGGPGVSNGRIICFKCGGLNHFSRDCKANSVKCFNCNGFGHLSRDCSEPAKVQTCYKCQQEGHIVSFNLF